MVMIFKILSVSNLEKTEHNINIIKQFGIKVTDVRIAPLVDKNDKIIQDLYVIICEGSNDKLEQFCKKYNLKYYCDYEGAPLYK